LVLYILTNQSRNRNNQNKKGKAMKIRNLFAQHAVIVLALAILSFSGPVSLEAQVVARDGIAWSHTVVVKFKVPVIDLPVGEKHATLAKIRAPMGHIRSYFARLGDNIAFEKLIPHAKTEDTLWLAPSGDVRKLHNWSQVFIVKFPQPVDVWKIIEELQKFPEVEYAQPPVQITEDLTPNDLHREGDQWYLRTVRAQDAWDITTGNPTIRVALIERGVAPHHDLEGKLVAGESGYSGSHGVMVAGVAGATTNNNFGIASLAWNIMLVPMNSANGTGIDADIRNAADPNGAHRADIINCSFKTITTLADGRIQSYDYPSVRQAVEDAQAWGRLVVASAGNPPGSNDADRVPFTIWPAAYAGVIGVSATNNTDQFPSGYNYGSFVDVSAPAIDILTLDVSGYQRVDGTSFSAPLTAALAGLIRSLNTTLTAPQIADVIIASADDLGPAGWDERFGHGRINGSCPKFS
jgi:subtilisin family serine protease